MFLCANQGKFQTFSILSLLNKFSGKRKPFSKSWGTVFQLKPLRLKTHHFHSKLLCQRPMLRQIEWRLQNGPTTKSGVLPVTTLFLLQNLLQFQNLSNRVNLMYQRPKCPYLYFSQALEFNFRVLFPVSILKKNNLFFAFFKETFNIAKSAFLNSVSSFFST